MGMCTTVLGAVVRGCPEDREGAAQGELGEEADAARFAAVGRSQPRAPTVRARLQVALATLGRAELRHALHVGQGHGHWRRMRRPLRPRELTFHQPGPLPAPTLG